MLVVGFDTETTGLNTSEDHIIQVGAVLWDTASLKKKAKLKFDVAIRGEHIPPIDPKITEINGLTNADLEKYGQAPANVFTTLNMLFEQGEAIVAHNGNLFDRPMYESNCKRHGIVPITTKLWVDTSCDIDYPTTIQTRKLIHLAAEHQFINPFPHDALSDVMTMLKIADLYDWEKTILWAKAPTVVIQAVSTFHQKELVKKQNYRWDNDNKIWLKSIKEFHLEDAKKAAKEAGFEVKILKK